MASRPDPRQSLNSTRADPQLLGHPRGLATLFFTEMWERFSYYGIARAPHPVHDRRRRQGRPGLLLCQSRRHLRLYTGMVYLLSLPGGWVADRITGQRRAVLYGGILIAAGQFCLVAPSMMTFYLGLVLLVMGNRPAQAQREHHRGPTLRARRRAARRAFSIFYMGINLGALISPFACGWVGEKSAGAWVSAWRAWA